MTCLKPSRLAGLNGGDWEENSTCVRQHLMTVTSLPCEAQCYLFGSQNVQLADNNTQSLWRGNRDKKKIYMKDYMKWKRNAGREKQSDPQHRGH